MREDPDFEEESDILTPSPEEAEAFGQVLAEAAASLPILHTGTPPKVLPIFPMSQSVPFPGLIMPVVARSGLEETIMEQAIAQGKKNGGTKYVGLILARGKVGSWKPKDFELTGVVAEVHKRIKLPDGNSNYVCRGLSRFQVDTWRTLKAEGRKSPVATVIYPEDVYPPGKEVEALQRNVLALSQKVSGHQPGLGDGFSLAAANMEPAGALADFSAAYLVKDSEEKQAILNQLDVRIRLQMVDEALTRELVTLELGDQIQAEIREKIEEQQKQFFLREQIKIIRRELGEEQEPSERDREYFTEKLEGGDYPEEVAAKVREEIERLSMVPTMSPEYPVVRNYLEWLVELPWRVSSDDRIDIDRAEKVLERDHFGLTEAKERILEFLGVRKMRPEHSGAILCFAGPPGVGKTSLAMAIAESMGRKLERMSLGGMRDEAEIKGHRRTYVGALPGRILQMVRRAGTNNPVIVLDEIDKIGKDFRGDPASALLEVLDPAQNHDFLDHYLDMRFDLSKVMFIATANVLQHVPPALRDRMEVIELPGYVTEEKVQIAKRHLLPRQLKEHGLASKRLKLPISSIRAVINGWTREAGVRGLEKSIASLCRKRTLQLARRKRPKPELPISKLEEFLGPKRFTDDRLRLRPEVGITLGLAYTPYGGDVLEIECVGFPGKGCVSFTGSLGDVMTESCRIAHSFLRANALELGIEADKLSGIDFHIHFPAGAIPKDGPSAGAAITCAMLSRLTGKRMKARTAMTGEITLTGEVLPVGGIREKVLAAKRLGIKTVLLPSENERDVTVLDEAWTKGLRFVYVSQFDEVLKAAFTKRS